MAAFHIMFGPEEQLLIHSWLLVWSRLLVSLADWLASPCISLSDFDPKLGGSRGLLPPFS